MKNQPLSTTPHRIEAIQAGIQEFLSGRLNANQLKPVLAPSGIYEQRDGRFMLRVRVTGGHITADQLVSLASIMDRRAIPSGHLTSRQAIQLHHVALNTVIDIIHDCQAAGLPFKGGGGNTYRNIAVSPDSGLGADQVFDVLPYAHLINQTLSTLPEAFLLPRKFKIGLFSNPSETFTAACQDLGFVATVSGPQRGFVVYGGGGIGRDSALGIKLFDFLPHDQAVRCVLALLHLFSEQGDHNNRHTARLRYVLQRNGAESFARLFSLYFEKTPWTPARPATPAGYAAPAIHKSAPLTGGFESWQAHAVEPSGLGPELRGVRLYVPYGMVTSGQLRRLAQVANEFGGGFLRLTPHQNLLLAPVHQDSLHALYERLSTQFTDLDLTLRSLRGHILTCVGSTICKVGILAAPTLADSLADHFASIVPADTPEKHVWLRQITRDIRISGCPNSCASHPAARFGFQGQKRKQGPLTEDVVLPFTGRSTQPGALKLAQPEESGQPIPVTELPAHVARALGFHQI